MTVQPLIRRCLYLVIPLLLAVGCTFVEERQKYDYDLAIAVITRDLKNNPMHPERYVGYNNRGEAYRLKGQLDRAIADYNKALEINPKYAIAYSNRGLALRRKGELDRAIADYNKALDIDPGFARAYANRAYAFYSKGEYDKTWDDVLRAQGLGQEIDPQFLADLRRASGREE